MNAILRKSMHAYTTPEAHARSPLQMSPNGGIECSRGCKFIALDNALHVPSHLDIAPLKTHEKPSRVIPIGQAACHCVEAGGKRLRGKRLRE